MRVGKEQKPGAFPVPDDQGLSNTCTRFALAKAICAGLHEGIWTNGRSVDVDQDWVTSAL